MGCDNRGQEVVFEAVLVFRVDLDFFKVSFPFLIEKNIIAGVSPCTLSFYVVKLPRFVFDCVHHISKD